MNKEKLEQWYKKNYKKLLFVPSVLLVISVVLIGIQVASTGYLFERDVSLKGGILATVYTDKSIDINALEQSLLVDAEIRRLTDFTTGKDIGITIATSDLSAEDLQQKLSSFLNMSLHKDNFSVNETGPKLGESFYKQLIIATVLAFLFMGLAVFLIFRTFTPSMAIIFATFSDIIITLAAVNLLGMKVSAAGIVSFLLLIGYSVDNNILLTTRAIKRRETSIFQRMYGSIKTGLTMSATALIVLIIGAIFTTSLVIEQMFTILIIGLLIDIIATYGMNTGLLYAYGVKKGL